MPTVQSTLKLADKTHFSLSANFWFFVIFNPNVVFNFFHFFGSTIGRAAFAFQTTGKKRFNNFNGDDMICVIFFFVMVRIVRQIGTFRVTFEIISCCSFFGTTKTHNSVFDTHDDQTCTVSQWVKSKVVGNAPCRTDCSCLATGIEICCRREQTGAAKPSSEKTKCPLF